MRASSRPFWLAGLVGAAVAAVVNLVVFALGRAADVPFVVTGNGSTTQIGAGPVAFVSVLSLLVGTVFAVLLARRGSRARRLAQAIGAAVALVSIAGPATQADEASTAVLLAAMHVIAGVVYVAAVEVAARQSDRGTAPAADAALQS